MEESLISGAVHTGKPTGILEQMHLRHKEAIRNLRGPVMTGDPKLRLENMRLLKLVKSIASENSELTIRVDEMAVAVRDLNAEITEHKKALPLIGAERQNLMAEIRRLNSEVAAQQDEIDRHKERAELLKSRPKLIVEVDLELIVQETAKYFGITVCDLISKRRQKMLVRARHSAIYLIKQLTPLSYPEIGRQLGYIDHTTILYADHRYSRLIKEDAALAAHIEEIKKRIFEIIAVPVPA